jgi:hypothetical protein
MRSTSRRSGRFRLSPLRCDTPRVGRFRSRFRREPVRVSRLRLSVAPEPRSSERGVSVSLLATRDLPGFFEQVDDDIWIDRRDDEVLSERDVLVRYGRGQLERARVSFDDGDSEMPRWLKGFQPQRPPTLIATRRLDLGATETRRRSAANRPGLRTGPIAQYARSIEEMVAAARRTSLTVSQRADRLFAVRALDKARATVKEAELKERYERVAPPAGQLGPMRSGRPERPLHLEAPPSDPSIGSHRQLWN